jgi:hypothetical protein
MVSVPGRKPKRFDVTRKTAGRTVVGRFGGLKSPLAFTRPSGANALTRSIATLDQEPHAAAPALDIPLLGGTQQPWTVMSIGSCSCAHGI